MLAATVRVTRDLDEAEEAVQDASLRALERWGRDGVPDRPGAWLTTVARRTALNGVRHREVLRRKLPLLVEPEAAEPPEPAGPIPDDRLRLVFTCCHPALAQEAQIALTLRLVCGVATADIAHAFLVPEPTMAARITRAKKKIAAARIPYAVPSAADLPARVSVVLTVVHLLFSAGHTASTGAGLVRDELTGRALDLARLLRALLPADTEVAGLLALLLVHQARRATRTDAAGRLLRLEDQDRARWDTGLIAEADRLVVEALKAGPPGRFGVQAAIAALHAQAPSYAETDWPQILVLYDVLLGLWPSPVVALNRAVALSMVDGPAAALAEVARLESGGRLAGYRYLPATKADLLHRLGRDAEAAEAYRAALELSDNAAEQEFLAARLSGA
ncbi:RNA polymerase sigma-70 factor (ECF subfamily) [Amycolatopsis lexingtonensis]|uniref:RNA polymerase sigma-70 factor (ECF subfamily) n=1 Tax=Amycolatopsis lexingtonensis TaxID=218822 RepID=A0ABR9IEF3_9PSEU|nr:RNA polymerase sigma-70 factor (ECF subfamily) [Amycolatopsis lexingtonensis]